MATTFEQLITATYKQLGAPSDSQNYDETDVVRPKINEVVDIVCKGTVRDVLTNELYTAGDLPFRRQTQFYTGINRQTLNADITPLSVTIDIDTAAFPAAGYVWIDNNIIQYTSKSATQLLGVTDIELNHYESTYVYPLYALPTNISKPFTLFHMANRGQLCEIPNADKRYPSGDGRYYSIVRNNDGVDLLYIHGWNSNNQNNVNTTRDRYVMYYYLNSVAMEDNEDECVIPDPYALRVIPAIVAGELLYDNEEVDDAATKLKKGYAQLLEMNQYYASQIKKSREIGIVEPMNLQSIYGGRYGYRGRKNYPW